MTNAKPVSVRSWPKAIVHIDGDSFFASCEQVMHREYANKPLVVGGERGVATAMSHEAKQLGITRAMKVQEIKRRFPQVIVAPSDYETYSLFSERMMAIVKKHTPTVEEYSIDECFAEITGLRKSKRKTYEDIAKTIKSELQKKLGLTFSVGLSVSKVMAKVATAWQKPDGFTAIKAKHIHYALQGMPVGKVWGIGTNTAARLEKKNVHTALDFAHKTEEWVKKHFSKPQVEIFRELNGKSVKQLETKKQPPKSISKTKTFTPPSKDREYVFSQLSKNIENACIKARRHEMFTDQIFIYLKTQQFESVGAKMKLSIHTNNPKDVIKIAKQGFAKLFIAGTQYRTTGVRFSNLVHKESYQKDLFSQHVEVTKLSNIFSVVDEIDQKFGKHSVHLGSSSKALTEGNYRGNRNTTATRKKKLLAGENDRQRISVPYLGKVT